MLHPFLALLAALATLPVGSPGPGEVLQPTDHASPSGRWVLHVAPSRPDGGGPAGYRMSRDGETVWEAERECTLWEAGVTDDGRVAGYGYTRGIRAGRDKGRFRVVVLDAAGRSVAEHAVPRGSSLGPGGHAVPFARDLLVQGELDRARIDMTTRDQAARECWWTFRLSDGERVEDWTPEPPVDAGNADRFLLQDAEPLPGSGLTLLRWDYRDGESTQGVDHWGALYELRDVQDATLWSLARPLEFTVLGDRRATTLLLEWSRACGTILACEPGGRFALWFPAESVRVDYLARHDGERWSVAETSRTALDLRLRTTWQAPAIELPSLPPVVLGAGTAEGGDAERPLEPKQAAIDARGQILVLDASDDGAVFVHASNGALEDVLRPPRASGLRLGGPGGTDERGVIHVPTIGTSKGYGYHGHLRFAPHYGAVGEVDLADHRVRFDPLRPRYWRPAPGARELLCFGDGPRPLHTLAKRPDGRWWNGIDDFACSADGGTLAVLDSRVDRAGRRHAKLALLDADGANGAMVEVPDTDAARVAVSPRWVVLSDHHATVLLVDRRDGSSHRLATEPTDAFLTWGVSPEGTELWCVDVAALTLHRYALPGR